MKVGVFLHGTAIMHATAAGAERRERVRQVRRRDPGIEEFASYIPTPGAVAKLTAWQRHGATLAYLSSHRRREDIRADEAVIRRHGFPEGPVHARAEGENYGALVARLGLDVLVEDDCESIGGATQTCAAQLTSASSTRSSASCCPSSPAWPPSPTIRQTCSPRAGQRPGKTPTKLPRPQGEKGSMQGKVSTQGNSAGNQSCQHGKSAGPALRQRSLPGRVPPRLARLW